MGAAESLPNPLTCKAIEFHGNSTACVTTVAMQGYRPTMEDSHCIVTYPDGSVFAGVFDGHSGSAAAEFCQREVAPRVRALGKHPIDTKIVEMMVEVDLDFHRMGNGVGDHHTGCTSVWVLIDEVDLLETTPHVLDLRPEVVVETSGSGNSATSHSVLVKTASTEKQMAAETNISEGSVTSTSGFDETRNLSEFGGIKLVDIPKNTAETLVTGPQLSPEMDPSSEKQFSVVVANVGDSRVIWGNASNPTDESYEQITVDHTPSHVGERQRIISAGGYITNTHGSTRIDGKISVSRAVGDWQFKRDAKRLYSDQKMTAIPDVFRFTAMRGEWILLACDGLFEYLSSAQIAAHVNSSLRNQTPLDLVIGTLLDKCLKSGSQDNMSAVLIMVGEDGIEFGKMESIMFLHLVDKDSSLALRKRVAVFADKYGLREETREKLDVPAEAPAKPGCHCNIQ